MLLLLPNSAVHSNRVLLPTAVLAIVCVKLIQASGLQYVTTVSVMDCLVILDMHSKQLLPVFSVRATVLKQSNERTLADSLHHVASGLQLIFSCIVHCTCDYTLAVAGPVNYSCAVAEGLVATLYVRWNACIRVVTVCMCAQTLRPPVSMLRRVYQHLMQLPCKRLHGADEDFR